VPTARLQTVLVILAGAAAPAGLARAAMRNGWPILPGPVDRARIAQSLACGASSVVIIHIPAAGEQGLELVHSLRTSWRSTVVIAIGDATTEDEEVLARTAGAGLYLSATADADLIERTVAALVVQKPYASRASRSLTGLAHERRDPRTPLTLPSLEGV
jgi:DNA-binding response OmpR family regulator